jgi:exodeoxyribonuclease-3
LKTLRILSWNVNGLRAIYKKGFVQWLKKDMPDILCLQETRAQEDQTPPELKSLPGHFSYYNAGVKKGSAGVGLISQEMPKSVEYTLGIGGFDDERRAIVADYGEFLLFNVYFPNGKASKERLEYKLKFYDQFLDQMHRLRAAGKRIVICGDFNTAHREIDLARPKANEKISGFLPQERARMDRLEELGFIDTFRIEHAEGGHYSWWDLKTGARARNVGWRIDYFFVSENLMDKVRSGFILKDVTGADHCPVGIELMV